MNTNTDGHEEEDRMKTWMWEDVKAETWASMTPAERREAQALAPQVEIELRAAELIYRARIDAGMTQSQLAKKAGTTQSYVSALETGVRTPTLAMLARIIAATGKRVVLTMKDPTPDREPSGQAA